MEPPPVKQLQNRKGDVVQSKITVAGIDEGAPHGYAIKVRRAGLFYDKEPFIFDLFIDFQLGDPKGEVNGVREEDLISMLIHKVECAQKVSSSPFNQEKLHRLQQVLSCYTGQDPLSTHEYGGVDPTDPKYRGE